jgi:competence protein ComEA
LAAPLTVLGQTLPDGPGKELVEVICSECHEPTRVIGKQWTKTEWQDKVLEMLQESPDVTQPERDRIVEYLSRNFFKKVNVNKAAAKELETALELSAKDAQAIVEYRTEKGAFKTTDDLKKVPGVDGAKIEAAKQRVEF